MDAHIWHKVRSILDKEMRKLQEKSILVAFLELRIILGNMFD